MKKYNKKGISLIVLVITIIVMIILAAAIILSISNSGIMDKANQAKTESDTANLKEYVNVLTAEWELMDTDEKAATNCDSSVAYVNAKLNEKGYVNKTYSADGEIYIDLPEASKNAIISGIEIGDKVNYTVTSKSETSTEANNGYGSQTIPNQTDWTWIYIGVNDNGELLISPDVSNGVPQPGTSGTIYLGGAAGWSKASDELDRICDKLYSVTGKGKARSMNMEDITRLLGYTGKKGAYYDGTTNTTIYTGEPKTIAELVDELGYSLSTFSGSLPESGKTIGEYYSDAYFVNSENIQKTKYLKYVYTSSGSYWLASTYTEAQFFGSGSWTAYFYRFYVGAGDSIGGTMIMSGGAPFAIRPVVTVQSTIQKSTENGSTVWNIV